MSRQNYYKQRQQRQRKKVDEELVVNLVKQERKRQTRIGTKKLHYLLQREFKEAGVKIGRDRLFSILRDKNMLVERLKGWPCTTDSRHQLPLFRNVVKELTITSPNQRWDADITYVRTLLGFVYLSLITDHYSRKIVGWNCADTLEASESIKALNMALTSLPDDEHPIHHSDRGSQYCCHNYVAVLTQRDLSISMTEHNHCAENAQAERVNGILKQEYHLGELFICKEHVHRAVEEAVMLYNYHRPHSSLNNEFPAVVHERGPAA